MGPSSTLPPWWDRETGDSGFRLRADVRAAAKELWPRICLEVKRILGDSSDAQELLEKAVQSVSMYLQKRGTESHDPSGLLIVAVYRNAKRLARKLGRLQAVGGSNELSEKLRAPDWLKHIDRRIFVEQLVVRLRPENRGILRLRLEDFSWEEIARMRRADASIVRKEFWRDLRRAHLQLLQQPNSKKREGD
jgi:hypothetical protein